MALTREEVASDEATGDSDFGLLPRQRKPDEYSSEATGDYDFEYDTESWDEGVHVTTAPTGFVARDKAQPPFSVLSVVEAYSVVEGAVCEIAAVFEWSATSALLLLQQHAFCPRRVQDRYFDDVLASGSSITNIDDRIVGHTNQFECPVCWDVVPSGLSLACSHACCVGCWRSYIEFQLDKNGTAVALSCPVRDCAQYCGKAAVDRICGPESVESRRYVERVVAVFVSSHPQYRACPSPVGCEFVLGLSPSVQRHLAAPVDCACGHRFCFHCGLEDHRPATCDMLRQWEADVRPWFPMAYLNQITATTKRCPGRDCGARVEKDGGCNHMTCTRCHLKWCWVCLKPWATHLLEQCNDNSAGGVVPPVLTIATHTLHFGSRFVSHKQSRSVVATLIKSRATMWLGDQAYLMAAAEVLAQCHLGLMYSYVFAYHLPDTCEKWLFEDLQLQLEGLVERLLEQFSSPDFQKGQVLAVASAASSVLAKIQAGL